MALISGAGAISAAGAVGNLVSGAPVRASLVPTTLGMPVFFNFNPQKVTVSKSAKTEGSRGLITNSFEDAVKAIGNLTISLNDVHFAGYLTKSTCDQLIGWTTPVPVPALAASGSVAARSFSSGVTGGGGSGLTGGLSGGLRGMAGSMASAATTRTPTAAGTYAGRGTVYKLPVLLFNWGGGGGPIGLSYKVTIEKVDVHYERFNAFGVPVWAKVNLTMKEYVEAPPLTNPTSGGPAGRTKHLVTAGENIVRIATLGYGTPAAWRAVAEANGLDDPLRIKPGRVLDLPGPEELIQGAES